MCALHSWRGFWKDNTTGRGLPFHLNERPLLSLWHISTVPLLLEGPQHPQARCWKAVKALPRRSAQSGLGAAVVSPWVGHPINVDTVFLSTDNLLSNPIIWCVVPTPWWLQVGGVCLWRKWLAAEGHAFLGGESLIYLLHCCSCSVPLAAESPLWSYPSSPLGRTLNTFLSGANAPDSSLMILWMKPLYSHLFLGTYFD